VRTAQRLAVDGDHIAVAEERRNLRQHTTEGGIQRLRIDQPEHRGIGVMRRYRMPEFKEAPENMLLCPAEGCNFGAVCCSAEHRDEGHHKQFAQVVTRIVCPGIGHLVEGGKKDLHAGNGLQKGVSMPRNPSSPKPQDPSDQVRSQTRFP